MDGYGYHRFTSRLIDTHIRLCMATSIPARKHQIEEWCETFDLDLQIIYAYTWQGEDFFCIIDSEFVDAMKSSGRWYGQ